MPIGTNATSPICTPICAPMGALLGRAPLYIPSTGVPGQLVHDDLTRRRLGAGKAHRRFRPQP